MAIQVIGNKKLRRSHGMKALSDASPTFTPSSDASLGLLLARIETAFTYPHGHRGISGVPEGSGCQRCNAERALQELAHRAASPGDQR